MKTEEPEPKAFQTDDPYAKAARALAEALRRRAISAARAAPRVLMISLEEAEKQADKLKVEIETLTESLAQERARADTLRALADAGIKEKIGRPCGEARDAGSERDVRARRETSNPAPVSSISSPPAWSAESFRPHQRCQNGEQPDFDASLRTADGLDPDRIHHHRFVDIVWSLIDPRLLLPSGEPSHPPRTVVLATISLGSTILECGRTSSTSATASNLILHNITESASWPSSAAPVVENCINKTFT
ncbi:hypothetical protein B0H14DRAFT_3501357 [Mycena olivaceomarginata]|nr:hypothetical protein B0H14DRAFT_3501357 [Mycena olivaceomarginata]